MIVPLLVAFLAVTASPQASAAAAGSRAFRPYLGRGRGEIDGVLAVSLATGQTVAKPGALIAAYPDLPYTRRRLAESAAALRASTDAWTESSSLAEDPFLRTVRRTVLVAANGAFSFRDLPRGRYLVRGRMSVAFPRIVARPTTVPVTGIDGQTTLAPDTRRVTVFDYSYVVLDSTSVYVDDRPTTNIGFRIVARRDVRGPAR